MQQGKASHARASRVRVLRSSPRCVPRTRPRRDVVRSPAHPMRRDRTTKATCSILSYSSFDLMIAFPPCTHLARSGAQWFPEKRADPAAAGRARIRAAANGRAHGAHRHRESGLDHLKPDSEARPDDSAWQFGRRRSQAEPASGSRACPSYPRLTSWKAAGAIWKIGPSADRRKEPSPRPSPASPPRWLTSAGNNIEGRQKRKRWVATLSDPASYPRR